MYFQWTNLVISSREEKPKWGRSYFAEKNILETYLLQIATTIICHNSKLDLAFIVYSLPKVQFEREMCMFNLVQGESQRDAKEKQHIFTSF